MNIARYGWIRDLPDHRDLQYTSTLTTRGKLPKVVDLRDQCPPVYDQGDLGSCTANAIAGALEFDELRAGLAQPWIPSRLFIYYNERAIEGSEDSDSGAQLRDGIKVIVREGVCSETEWPYDISRFATKPPAACYKDAAKDRVSSYMRVAQSLLQIKACLADGFPCIFGFSVFDSMESDIVKRDGIVPMPEPTDSLLGGHAVACVGYDDRHQYFLFRNSWGEGWGDKGYGYLPYTYVLDPGLAADFWTIRSAPGGIPLTHHHTQRHTGSPSQRVEE